MDESLEDAARRELREETGFRAFPRAASIPWRLVEIRAIASSLPTTSSLIEYSYSLLLMLKTQPGTH
ncbi:NUDIX domain-containing protein [Acaryochloris marina]|uniref:NUDIX domain-containing protein n=1 Tax=Acaryochloris marina TaxID=155978 RepID=UPI0021C27C50|nr:NUDIX domain-containing protein [Acaryochloris marina]